MSFARVSAAVVPPGARLGRTRRLKGLGQGVGTCCVLCLLILSAIPAYAAGARFVSGPGMAVNAGLSENWAVTQLRYFTDSGALASGVTHAQADTMVAAAAGEWNVATSSLTLAQGGVLAEHVSSADTYLGSSGVVFPTDVQATNEGAVPIAIVYDTDGSVTDLLLGSGASDPVSCRQNAVTESVDDIQTDGHIHHAVVLLNGRCAGSAPEQLLQMQYQLTRAFGRVLGLAWSQVNDNVFTAAQAVTADQETYWPVMHPLDVLCGNYTYQCMQNPFTLRADDLSSLSALYPVTSSNLTAGKQLSSTDAVFSWGRLLFPSGQGMDWVNVTAHRLHAGVMETWDLVSATTGATFQEALQNPVTQVQASSAGTSSSWNEGFYEFQAVPIDGLSNLYFTTEAINPLYTGAYALAPYVRPPVTPSGSPQTTVDYSAIGTNFVNVTATASDAADPSTASSGGTEGAPATFDASGFQAGLLGAWNQSSWWSAPVRAGRTWTLEVTATDESGAATGNKAQPVLGVWNNSDSVGTVPTIAGQAVPFNSMVPGMTQLHVSAGTADKVVRMVIGDQFNAGRPDFSYSARMLYADVVSPTAIGQGGGVLTILGTGFQQGNVVKINGVAATVQSLSAGQITVLVPSAAAVKATLGRAVSVAVGDLATGGTTSITAGLTYTQGADLLREVSAPAALKTGDTSTTAFAVQVLAADGVTPLAGATVSLGVTTATAQLGACGAAASCWVVSDSNGQVQSSVSGVAGGAVTLTATEISGGATIQAKLTDTDPVRSVAFSSNTAYVAAGGTGGNWSLQLQAVQDGVVSAGIPIIWTASAGVQIAPTSSITGADGTANISVSVGNLASGVTGTLTACVWNTICSTWTVLSIDASQWQVSLVGGTGQSVPLGTSLQPLQVQVTTSTGNPLQGALLTVWQRVLAWEGLCTGPGVCPAAPVLQNSTSVVSTDAEGSASLVPLQVAGQPQTLQAVVSWGQSGMTTCTLVTLPSP